MKCDFCNKDIVGQYLIDSWGQKYHLHHSGDANHCGSCTNIVIYSKTPKPKKLIDGRVICSHCLKDSILNDNQMTLCVNAVYKFYKMGGIVFPEDNIRFKLVYSFRLGENTLGRMDFDGERYTIKMLKGLNKTLFCGVLSHELMHVLINELQIIFEMYESEGLCELAKYFALKMFDSKYAESWIESMEANPDPIYGEGFRIMKERIKQHKSIQNYLKTKTTVKTNFGF